MNLKNLYTSLYLALGLGIGSTSLATAQDAKPTQPTTPTKADLKLVTSKLDLDGHFFLANNIEGDLSILATMVNDWAKTARANGYDKIPENFDATAMLKTLGLDHVVAYGRSAKQEGDHWVNKMYVQTGGSNQGLLTFVGGKAEPYIVPSFAPAETDMAFEKILDLRQVPDMVALLKNLPECPKSKRMLAAMDKKLTSGKTMAELLQQLKMKISVAVVLDSENRLVSKRFKGISCPTPQLVCRISGANALWQEMKPMMGMMMKAEKRDDGTLLLSPRKSPNKGFMKGKKPVIVVDEAKNLIWMTSDQTLLEACLSKAPKLANNAEFKAITGGATEGNVLVFLSKHFCDEYKQVKTTRQAAKDRKMLSEEMVKKIGDYLTKSKNGYSLLVQNEAAGFLVTLRAPLPLKEMMGKGCCKKYGKRGCSKCKKGACNCKKDGKCGCEKGKCSCDEKSHKKKEKAGSCDCKKGGKCECEKSKCGCDDATKTDKSSSLPWNKRLPKEGEEASS